MPSTVEPLTEKDKITILLAEYTTLRSEAIQRYASSFQLITFGAATAALVNVFGASYKWAIIACIAILVSVYSYIILSGIRQLAERIREIEAEVNRRAKEELLVWETRTEAVRRKFGSPHLGRDIENHAHEQSQKSGDVI